MTAATTGVTYQSSVMRRRSGAPSSGCFVTQDGVMIMLAANNERQFVDLCAALGHAEWAVDPVGSNPGNALFMPMNCVNTLPRPFCCVRLQMGGAV
ncbi:MAG: hypothetical protein CM15mP120_28600 [Pseudomonadota bacterium]|nr:MAG: hypothetical protein CM15mP120_28600 [Pseudomonadota bacterium]